jgi:hypothetical protein
MDRDIGYPTYLATDQVAVGTEKEFINSAVR